MRNGSEIEALLDSLEALLEEAQEGRIKWGDIWREIRNIQKAFKESRFPTAQDRQAAWGRFQSIIAKVKTCQERARREFEEILRRSEYHLEQIRYYAWRATPPPEIIDAILAICTGGLTILIKAGLEAILGPFDERKLVLQKCSEALKEGWAYLSRHKGEMLGKHKKEAFDALSRASELLGQAWDIWRTGKKQAIEHYRRLKQEAREARQAKREAWEIRMRENISKLEDRLERLKRALDRRRSNLARLEAMRDSARSDSYRKRIDDWIEEERSRIAEIEGKIEQVEAWISEARDKLR